MGILPVEPENPYWKDKSETYEDPDGWRVILLMVFTIRKKHCF